ncbi:MAG: hypothetical protein U9Q04_07805 [Campylobacterota bacterium]|nr:hypothetical protein [Campylobacterota bacterium]
MIKFYLKPLHLLILTIPLAVLSYIYFNPKDTIALIKPVEQFIEETINFKKSYNKTTKESLKNKFYRSLGIFKQNVSQYDESLYYNNVDTTRWTIAYLFKYLNFDPPERKVKEVETINENDSLSKKVEKLRELLDQNNNALNSTLKSSQDADIKAILDIIKSRKLSDPTKAKKDNYRKINWNLYDLQLVLISKNNKNKAVINNKIYKEKDYINKDLRVMKIERDRVFIKSDREEKWIKLLN